MQLTPTMILFAFALCVFGPLFGFWGAYLCRSSRLGALWGFLLAGFFAYLGWFVSGLTALCLYPHYPKLGPAESTALLFTLPGFLTGLIGIAALKKIARPNGTTVS